METQTQISKWLSPEDINIGDYITVTHMTYELIVLGCEQPWNDRIEPKPVTILHHEAGKPLKVIELCLPFVLVKDAKGQHAPLDLRRCRIARLTERYGKKMFKCAKAQ